MSLSCSCPDYDNSEWFYWEPTDFKILETKKRKRCKSCNTLIDLKALCLMFPRWRYPKSEIELKIYSEDRELPLGSYYMCETCGEHFMNLTAIGYCVDINESMEDLLEEYQDMVKENGIISQPEPAS